VRNLSLCDALRLKSSPPSRHWRFGHLKLGNSFIYCVCRTKPGVSARSFYSLLYFARSSQRAGIVEAESGKCTTGFLVKIPVDIQGFEIGILLPAYSFSEFVPLYWFRGSVELAFAGGNERQFDKFRKLRRPWDASQYAAG
jgi:hypothetical protein